MRVSGHTFSEHVRLIRPLLLLIALVWFIRFFLTPGATPKAVVDLTSVTAIVSVAVILAVLRIYARDFGGYASVVLSTLLLVVWGQLLVVAAILFSVFSGIENIYTAPEFSLPIPDPYHFRHVVGHLTFGVGAGTLVGSAMGCLLLFILRILINGAHRGNDRDTKADGRG